MRGWIGRTMLGGALAAVPLPILAQDASPPAESGAAPVPAGPPAASDAIFWYPAPSRCTYSTPEQKAAFRFEDPGTWRFSFLVMAETSTEAAAEPVERGYVMNDGVLRELEKVRSGADGDKNTVTVWRSVGEPRINVNVTLKPDGTDYEQTTYRGRMTLIRGDGKVETDIVGSCGG